MTIAIVAEADSGERVRCLTILARQSLLGALGASHWLEVEQVLATECDVGLVVFQSSLPGAPANALDTLVSRARRLAVIDDAESATLPEGTTRLRHPVQAEPLVLLARSTQTSLPPNSQATFQPVALVQMLCMTDESHVLVISNDGSDVGVVEIRDGALWTAYDSLGVGDEAFARLMHPVMRARTSPGQGLSAQRTITASHEEMLIESLRLIDEGKVTLPPPLSASALQPVADAVHKRDTDIAELVGRARRLLTDRNYNEATRALVRLAERDPSSQLVRANLAQLHSLGYPND